MPRIIKGYLLNYYLRGTRYRSGQVLVHGFAAASVINILMKLQQILEVGYHRDEGNIELTQAPHEPSGKKKQFDRLVNNAWHKGVMYNGENVFSIFYEGDGAVGDLAKFLEKELKEDNEGYHHLASYESQESYLGYIPTEDLFVMGFDTFAEEVNQFHNTWDEDDDSDETEQTEVPCMMFVKIVNGGPEDWRVWRDGPLGAMYPHGRSQLHSKYPSTVDVRLD